ncbi:HD-GYP domain-containing protein [Bacillus sp. AK031]
MRFIDISDYQQETMQLAKPIYDRMRRILLTAGRTIHPTFLKRISEMGISTLVVEDAESKGITLDEMLDMPTWMDTIETVQQAFNDARNKKRINAYAINNAVGKLIHELSRRKIIILIPSSSISEELVEYAHAVNVALVSIQMGKKLNYNGLKLRDLAVGALLHDIGKTQSQNEKDHPKQGFDIIRDNREISLLSAHIAYQHHEVMTGEGYPRGLSGNEILEFPQICAIANLYENLTSKEKVNPDEVLELIMSKNGVEYKENVVHSFVNSIPSYAPGTKVELNDGEEAIVIALKSHLHRPIIRYKNSGEVVDLAESHTTLITRVIN